MSNTLKRKLDKAIESAWLKHSGSGRFRAADVVADLLSDTDLMDSRADLLADALTRRVTHSIRTLPADPRQHPLPEFESAPTFIAISGGEWIALEKTTAGPLRQFTERFEARLQIKLKSANNKAKPDFSADRKTLAGLQRLGRIMARYEGKNPDITVEEALRLREKRKIELLAKRNARRNRR
jgi:hypothetical protein